jgi:hypothetical protein
MYNSSWGYKRRVQYYSIDFRISGRKETAVPMVVNDNQEERQ